MYGQMYACTDGQTFETGFIRSTLSKGRPKNECVAILPVLKRLGDAYKKE